MVLEKVRKMISKQLDIDMDRIDENTDIADDLGADSLDLVELLMEAEEVFPVTFDENAMKDFKTVGDVVKYIEENS